MGHFDLGYICVCVFFRESLNKVVIYAFGTCRLIYPRQYKFFYVYLLPYSSGNPDKTVLSFVC